MVTDSAAPPGSLALQRRGKRARGPSNHKGPKGAPSPLKVSCHPLTQQPREARSNDSFVIGFPAEEPDGWSPGWKL